MCGITGIIMKDSSPVDKNRLTVMNDAGMHRGPDGEGFYINGNVGFGHRRLAILDLSNLGSQPMKYNEDYIITYNGEVYNYIELKESLKGKGYRFNSGTDTEVILAAYQEWGKDCVHQFNGMWAFAIHDKRKNIVFISRDRFGVKPFHYYEDDSQFLFGSEIKQILTQLSERKVNRQVLFDYLYLGYHHHTNATFFQGISSLDPGHSIIFDLTTSTYTISKWYSLKKNEKIKDLSTKELESLFEATLDKAIQLRLRSDVKVGTCLSGGLDSSYIATVAAKTYNVSAIEKFTAITAKSFEKENDESGFAEMVAEKAGLNWKISYPQKEDFIRVVDDVIKTQEEPFGSPSIIMQYFVMQKAKEEGCIVLLDGQGGDEALLGYDRYYAVFINQQKGIFNKIKSYCSISANSRLNIRELFFYKLYFTNATVRAARQLIRNNYINPKFKSYLNKDLLKIISDSSKDISALQELEITKVQLQKLLKYEDRNSMRFSIETRVPFVDFNFMELAFSLPISYKVQSGWSKFILRKVSEKKLPHEIAWRKAKFGFEAPKNWFGDKRKIFETIDKNPFLDNFVRKRMVTEKIDDISLWKLYNLAIWAMQFNVKF